MIDLFPVYFTCYELVVRFVWVLRALLCLVCLLFGCLLFVCLIIRFILFNSVVGFYLLKCFPCCVACIVCLFVLVFV